MSVAEELGALTVRTGGVLKQPPRNGLVRVIQAHDGWSARPLGFGDFGRGHVLIHRRIMRHNVLFVEGGRWTGIKRWVKYVLIQGLMQKLDGQSCGVSGA